MPGLDEFFNGIKGMEKEVEKLNAKMSKLDSFDQHVVESTAVMRELTVVTKELVKVIKEKNI